MGRAPGARVPGSWPLAGAFENPAVQTVTATTYATLEPAIGVLRKTGFAHVRSDPGTGLVHYERRRLSH